MTAIKMWLLRWMLRGALKIAMRMTDAAAESYFSRQRAFEWRQWVIKELLEGVEWCKAKTPKLKGDERVPQFLAWVMESDTIQAGVNTRTGKAMDVHARWHP